MAKGDKVSWTNYTEKQREKGLIKVAAWIPETHREEFLDIANEMCREVGAVSAKRKRRTWRKKADLPTGR